MVVITLMDSGIKNLFSDLSYRAYVLYYYDLKVNFVQVYHIIQIQKFFQNVMWVGMASEISKRMHTIVWIAQDTTDSRVPRLKCAH